MQYMAGCQTRGVARYTPFSSLESSGLRAEIRIIKNEGSNVWAAAQSAAGIRAIRGVFYCVPFQVSPPAKVHLDVKL
jgi:hypothetical protein